MIELVDIQKSFQNKLALDGVSFTIPKGKVFGLIGPNGAGKTTLIRILNQILSPSSGSVMVQGMPLTATHVRSFGYLPEERGLYREMTVKNHLIFLAKLRGLSGKEAQANVIHWLKKFGISDWENKRIDALSKGMAQKIQFIAAVVHGPEVIILDEPLSGFDPLNIQLILDEIKTFVQQDKTVVFSTHNMQSVDELCDEVALIHQGKLLANDKVADLRSKHRNGDYKIRFRGNAVAFANALWTGFEIIETKELSENYREAVIRKRADQSFNDVFTFLSGSLSLELIEEQIPSMQDVFVKLIAAHHHEE